MSGDEIGRLIYLMLLGTAIAGYFLVAHRDRMGQVARHGLLWGLIFLGVIAGVGLWSDFRQQVAPRQAVFAEGTQVELPRAPDGHYYMTILVNGAPIRFVVDTGATDVVLTKRDARQAGLDPSKLDYFGEARTANGTVQTAPVRLREMRVGEMVDRDVRAFVNAGEMRESLLGMGYLNRFERIEFVRNRMILTR